jgi:hypothetical protein
MKIALKIFSGTNKLKCKFKLISLITVFLALHSTLKEKNFFEKPLMKKASVILD